MTVKIVPRRHSDDNPCQFTHPKCTTAVGKRKEELAQDQNIPTAIFKVFRNQNMTSSSVRILNCFVFIFHRLAIFEKNYITQPRV